MIRLYPLLFASLLAVVNSAVAAPPGPVRCEGRIQFRPCPVPPPQQMIAARLPLLPQRRLTQPLTVPQTPRNLFARVAKASFERVGARDGFWRGVVSGNGLVHLHLLIRRHGLADQRWEIGRIHLKNGKSTHFGFRTVAPPGERWTWEVVANATHERKA